MTARDISWSKTRDEADAKEVDIKDDSGLADIAHAGYIKKLYFLHFIILADSSPYFKPDTALLTAVTHNFSPMKRFERVDGLQISLSGGSGRS